MRHVHVGVRMWARMTFAVETDDDVEARERVWTMLARLNGDALYLEDAEDTFANPHVELDPPFHMDVWLRDPRDETAPVDLVVLDVEEPPDWD